MYKIYNYDGRVLCDIIEGFPKFRHGKDQGFTFETLYHCVAFCEHHNLMELELSFVQDGLLEMFEDED